VRELSNEDTHSVNGGNKFITVVGSTLIGAAMGAVTGAVTLGPIGILAGGWQGAVEGMAVGLAVAGGEGLVDITNGKN